MSGRVEWFRPEYEGRWSELVPTKEVLALTGLTSSRFSTWRRRQPEEPKPVCKKYAGKGEGAQFYYVRAELEGLLSDPPSITRARYEEIVQRMDARLKEIRWLEEQERKLSDSLKEFRQKKARLKSLQTHDQPIRDRYEKENPKPLEGACSE